LANAGNDATGIMNVLKNKYGFTVMSSLFNEEATANQIRELFDETLQDRDKIGPKDRVVIYYSGHGKLKVRFGRSGEEIKDGYIVPYDSRKIKYSSNISMKTIIEACQNCPAKHVLLILDCCYSGFAAQRAIEVQKPPKTTENYIKDISSRTAIQVLAAGQEDQPVSDSGIRPGYSAFTGALLDILETEMDPDNNGILTASEIGFILERQVSLQEQRGAYQRPLYTSISGSRGGDFIFKIFDIKITTQLPQRPPNHPPIADTKIIEANVSTPIQIMLTGSDPDPHDTLSFSVISNPQHGRLIHNNIDNNIIYTPNTGFTGTDSFTYKATDGQGVDSSIAKVTITVNPVQTSFVKKRKKYYRLLIPVLGVVVAGIIVLVLVSSGMPLHQVIPSSIQPAAPSPKPINAPPVIKIANGYSFITKWGSTGRADGQFEGFVGPNAVATDSSGNVYVVDGGNNRIQKFNSNGSFITKWGSGSYGYADGYLFSPAGIAVDSSGNVYVTDNGHRRIQVFSPSSFVSSPTNNTNHSTS